MSIIIEIEGVDKTSLVQQKQLSVTDELNSRNTYDLEIVSTDGTYRPAVGHDVVLTNSGVILFAGTIDTLSESSTNNGITPSLSFQLGCVDYNQLCDRFLVADVYDSHLAGNIVKHIITDFINAILPGEGITYVNVQDGPTISKAVFNYISATQALDELAEISGFCVDIETEALTKRGWVNGNNLTKDDIILSMKSDGKLAWSKIFNIYRNENYDGPMYHLTGRRLDSFVTPGHKFPLTNGNLIKVENLRERDVLRTMGDYVENENQIYPDYFVELMGWVITEGHYVNLKRCNCTSVQIYQNNNTEKCQRIEKILNQTNSKWHKHISNRGLCCFNFSGELALKVREIAPERILNFKFIHSLTQSQRLLILKTMIDGDGSIAISRNKFDKPVFVQKDKRSADAFAMIATLAGIPTYIRLRTHPLGQTYGVTLRSIKTVWVCTLKGAETIGYGPSRKRNPQHYYKGLVWCPETEYGTFVCRRSGIVHITGNSWWIDYTKDMHFCSRLTNAAPFALTDTSNNYRNLSIKRTRQDYRNKEYFRGGQDISSALTETFKGDGENATFSLTLPCAKVPSSVTVDAAVKTIGIRQVETGKDWYWNEGDREITQDTGGAKLTSANILSVTYQGYFPIVIESVNESAIAERKLVEGGTGIYEHAVTDTSINTSEAVQERANALVRKYGEIPETVEFETDSDGLKAGQLINITVTKHNLNAAYLIQRVTIQDITSNILRYQVTAMSGEYIGGWIEFFKGLAKAGQGYVIRENEVLVKNRNLTDNLRLTDTLTVTSGSPIAIVGSSAVGYSEAG